jgi:hypothetical protein
VEVVALPTGEEEDAAESSTLFVKNLAFATSDAGLQVRRLRCCLFLLQILCQVRRVLGRCVHLPTC